MLAPLLPLGLLLLSTLASLTHALPVTPNRRRPGGGSSELARRALVIPEACEQTCSSWSADGALGSPCGAAASDATGACLEAVCQSTGLDSYGPFFPELYHRSRSSRS